MNNLKLRRDAEKSPVWHALVVWLFAVGLVALPVKKLFSLFIGDETFALYTAEITVRAVLTAVAVIFVFKYRFNGIFSSKIGKAFLLTLPAFIVAINNFPIIGFISGEAYYLNNTWYFVLFLINCLFIGAFEEIVFRGIIFPLIFIRLGDKKYSAFFAAAISSAVFAASHLINLLGGAGILATLLQVGYSFLIGGMCAVTLLMTGNIAVAVLLHFIYDIGGFILASEYKVASGFQWDAATIIITAVIGVAVAVYMIVYALKNDGAKLKKAIYNNFEIKDEADAN